jgi:hypothetical protein
MGIFQKKVHPSVGGSVVFPGIMVDVVKAYQSLLKLKQKADIICLIMSLIFLKWKVFPNLGQLAVLFKFRDVKSLYCPSQTNIPQKRNITKKGG